MMPNSLLFRSAVLIVGLLALGLAVTRNGLQSVAAGGPQLPVKAIETLPASRGGQDLVGTRLPPLHFDRWLATESGHAPDSGDGVTLYRWWTDTCPFCAATLPAIDHLRKQYGDKGLRVVAVYHPKPPRAVKDEDVLTAAKRLGFGGPIAIDADWSQLRKAYLHDGRRGATSISLLVDRQGIIRFVHPGVQFFPSTEPTDAQEDADYRLMERAIAALLDERK